MNLQEDLTQITAWGAQNKVFLTVHWLEHFCFNQSQVGVHLWSKHLKWRSVGLNCQLDSAVFWLHLNPHHGLNKCLCHSPVSLWVTGWFDDLWVSLVVYSGSLLPVSSSHLSPGALWGRRLTLVWRRCWTGSTTHRLAGLRHFGESSAVRHTH